MISFRNTLHFLSRARKPGEWLALLLLCVELEIPAALLVLGLLMAACRPLTVMAVSPSGPPEYQLGWEDGCDSALSAEGSWEYKVMYGYKKRHELAAHEQYKVAWNEGFAYCRFALSTSQAPGRWDSIGLGKGF